MATRKPKNLLLSVAALARAEDYCRQHETTLSGLVEEFLMELPLSAPSTDGPRSPIVQRLSAGIYDRARDDYKDFNYQDILERLREQTRREDYDRRYRQS